ncbi:hypothetical protein HHK36_028289 [Tetracentron sinense]|uniref:Glycosyltransferase n=1 Tax=Tetracentron sinense TaxID=13715 RepID=A0A834YI71_TETSI|nr:hypothetical protein HHK36_028289 [Tetracentron sinense]
MEYALWKLGPKDMKPGEIYTLPGLPGDMFVSSSDLTHRGPPPPQPHHAGGPPGGGGGPPGRGGGGPPPPGPPPKPGQQPPWVGETEGSIALMINTCDDLEGIFIDYVAKQTGKPVWGVGPLLPAQYWRSADSLVHDHDVRTKRESNISEEEVSEWLDSKPRGSVLYVSFGTEVGPTVEDLAELAGALEDSNRPFIWVLQSSRGPPGPGPKGGPPGGIPGPGPAGGEDYYPDEMARRVEGRGLIIRGWAPQLMILSHPSTGGFLTHCGWNSTVEAIGRGVPMVTWPIRGDQHYNAKLVVLHMKVGSMIEVGADASEKVRKDAILRGIETVMADDEIRKRAASISAIFDHGFPASSVASLNAFKDFMSRRIQH